MLIAAIESIMKPCYKDNVVYLHNFSYFDAVFLIKILSSFNAKFYPIIRNNCIIDFKFKFLFLIKLFLIKYKIISNNKKTFKIKDP